jgi:hypothetical protein
MKKRLCFLACWVSLTAVAQPTSPATLEDVLRLLQNQPPVESRLAERARVRVLEFASNRLTELDLVADQATAYQELELVLKSCQKDYQGVTGQDVAWVEIYEQVTPAVPTPSTSEVEQTIPERRLLFSGWMFNTFTDVSTLDHPKYDVRVTGCLTSVEVPVVRPMGLEDVEELEILSPEEEGF